MKFSCLQARCGWRFAGIALPACVGFVLFATIPAEARGTGQGEARIAQCIHQAAGGSPWLEKTLWGLHEQEGGWIGAEVQNTNGSHDLGPLQINSWWVPKIAALVGRRQTDVRAWLTRDACFNAGAARWIFLSALRATGDFWKAVGVYHSPTAWRQRRYALSVAHHMQRRFGNDIFAVPMMSTSIVTGSVETDGETKSVSPVVRVHGFGVVQTPPS